MTLRELDRLFLSASNDIDIRQRARIRELRRIVDTLVEQDGVITTRKGSASINKLIDVAFGVIERTNLKAFRQNSLADLTSILGSAGKYYQAQTSKQLNKVTARANAAIQRRLGIDPKTGDPLDGGTFDNFFDQPSIRTEVKQAVSRAITSKKPMPQLLKQIRTSVEGTTNVDGVFSKAFKNLVLDTYQQTDRAINKEYADRLVLDTFIYAGGLIETSREFCKKRNNQVFTEEEAAKWKDDPTLPRTKKEKDSGVLAGYDPLIDIGRWNCRHRLRYISKELAKELKGEQAAPTPTVEDVMEAAKKSAPQLDEIANRIAQEHGATVTPTDLKSQASIMRKATNDYGGDVSQVKDAVRNTIIAPRDGIEGVLKSLQGNSIFARLKRQLSDQDALGYSGNIVNVRMANGSLGEIQVNTAKMIYAKEKPVDARRILGDTLYDAIGDATGIEGGLGHTYYEEWRTLKPQIPDQAARMAEIEALSRGYYSNFYE